MFAWKSPEQVITLEGFPQSSPGAPCPALFATEHSLAVVFHLYTPNPNWDGTSVRVIDVNSESEPIAVVTFDHPSIHTFGPPNDEAFSGHPLASKGLKPYGAFEVIHSRWIHQLEKMNSVHPCHNREKFLAGKRHFILTFHDSTFECIAHNYKIDYPKCTISQAIQSHVNTVNA